MSKPYPFLKLEAPPVERGRLLGQTFKNKINSSIENYKRMFKDFSGINWDEAKKRALEFLPFIKEYSPKAIEEIEGIAEGSQEDFESILTLNCRSEIVLDSYVDGCTAFGLSSNITSDSKTYICQNWDWIRQQHDSLVVIEIKQPPEPTILMIAEAGIISGKGINSAGVGVGFNALTTGQGTLGVPVHFILRKILDSRHLADTVKAVAEPVRASSANFMIGNSEGEIIDIESAPEDFWVFYAEKGWLAHTNHFTAPNLLNKTFDKGKIILPDSFQRLGRINTLLTLHQKNVGFSECFNFLSDHKNFPDSICRHEDHNDPKDKRLASVYSIIMDLNEGIIWLSPSNPCKSAMYAYGPVGDWLITK